MYYVTASFEHVDMEGKIEYSWETWEMWEMWEIWETCTEFRTAMRSHPQKDLPVLWVLLSKLHGTRCTGPC